MQRGLATQRAASVRSRISVAADDDRVTGERDQSVLWEESSNAVSFPRRSFFPMLNRSRTAKQIVSPRHSTPDMGRCDVVSAFYLLASHPHYRVLLTAPVTP